MVIMNNSFLGRNRRPRCFRCGLLPLFLLLFLFPRGQAHCIENQGYHFDSLTIEDGLPDNTVRCLIQDHTGFLWFGTGKGVVRYDGYNMVPLVNLVSGSTLPVAAPIKHLHQDRSGRIWIAYRRDGLGIYDPGSGSYSVFTPQEADSTSLPSSRISDVCEDRQGNIWIATYDSGFCRYVESENKFHRYRTGKGVFPNIPDNVVSSVAADSTGQVWIGFISHGVAKLDIDSREIEFFSHNPEDSGSLPGNEVRDIYVDKAGLVWIATSRGLARWQEQSQSFQSWHPAFEAISQSGNSLLKITQDQRGKIWVGSEIGLLVFDPISSHFSRFSQSPEYPGFPAVRTVIAPFCDSSGIVWAGTWLSGLVKYDPRAQYFDNQAHDRDDPLTLDSNLVNSILQERDGTLWVGTGSRLAGGSKGGLNRQGPGSRGFIQIEFDDSNVLGVTALAGNSSKIMYIGTNSGLWKMSRGEGKPERIILKPDSKIPLPIRDILLDTKGNLWVGSTSHGLFLLPSGSEEFHSFVCDANNPTCLSSRQILCLHEDAQGRIWIGTDGGGLNLFDPIESTFSSYFRDNQFLASILDVTHDGNGNLWVGAYGGLVEFSPELGVQQIFDTDTGLPNDLVGSLQLDSQGRVWFSTGRGLVRLDPDSGSFKVFTTVDGLPGNGLCRAQETGPTGRFFFGGEDGLFSFLPRQLQDRTFPAPVVITGLTTFGGNQDSDENRVETINGTDLHSLDLAHDRNDLSITFAALDFSRPEAIIYRYRLDNYDRDWRVADSSRTAVYSNLAPGNYQFRVRATNGDGVWNQQERTLTIHISPPWWKTWWSYLLYFLLAMLVLVSIIWQVIIRERMRGTLEVQKMKARQLQELNGMRSRFFANISHEFRTPLALIKGPLHQLWDDPDSGNKQTFAMMMRNSNRLKELIDQLLDLSRLEANELPIRRMFGDGPLFLGQLIESYFPLAEERNISLQYNLPENHCEGWFDPDLTEKVIGNLMMNAVKFTPPQGTIRVNVRCGDMRDGPWLEKGRQDTTTRNFRRFDLIVTVANSGSFIPAEERAHIFDRFYQVITKQDSGDVGTGIGLALVKDLVTLQGGSIQVDSEPGGETSFLVKLPILLDEPVGAVSAEDMDWEDKSTRPHLTTWSGESQEDPDFPKTDVNPEAKDAEPALPLLLVVEDHGELRDFLKDQLKDEYRLLEAADGKAGLEMAIANIPDLVLSDIMMPKMDGFELCNRLKSDRRTSHIPIVLLTARTEQESRMQGLELGADTYLSKPFDPRELKTRIKNLIEMQARLREVFAAQFALNDPAIMPESNEDERFLKDLQTLISDRLTDSSFKVETMAREICMSRMNLHRKLKALTGESPGNLLRSRRLKYAAKLLDGGNISVTESVYASGFNSMGHFSSKFKVLFGMTPSEYRNRKRSCSDPE